MANDLGLAGDGDEIELIEGVEAAFRVTFKHSELEQMATVGHLFDALLTRFGDKDQRANLCFSAIVFYRLRRAILPFISGKRIGPKFALKSEMQAERTDKIVDHLEKETGLVLPSLDLGLPQALGLFLVLSAFFLPTAVQGLAGWPPLIGFLAIPLALWGGIKLVKLRRGQLFSIDYTDLGTLVCKVVALNYGELTKELGYPGDDDLWSAFTAIVRDFSERPDAIINRDTRLIVAPPMSAFG